MPNRIKADSASGLQLISDSSDEIQIQSGSDTVAIVNSSGITMGSGKNFVETNAPAFHAYTSTTTTLNAGVATKAIFNNVEFDTTSDFDTSLYRFTPSVAGYYQFNSSTYINSGVADGSQISIRVKKNGTTDYYGSLFNTSGTDYPAPTISILLYANGSTDYFEIYVRQGSGASETITSTGALSWFTGHLVRAV